MHFAARGTILWAKRLSKQLAVIFLVPHKPATMMNIPSIVIHALRF